MRLRCSSGRRRSSTRCFNRSSSAASSSPSFLATGITGVTDGAFTVPTGPGQTNVALLAAPDGHRGAYSFTPSLGITIPAAAQASYAGNPYAAVLTITIS